MPIVFGNLDMPIFEILFVVSILLVVGLVIAVMSIFYILRELRTFKQLLAEEQKDVEELDKDIRELDKLSSKTSPQAKNKVQQYIKSCLDKGYAWPAVRKSLMDKGWKADKLDQWRQL